MIYVDEMSSTGGGGVGGGLLAQMYSGQTLNIAKLVKGSFRANVYLCRPLQYFIIKWCFNCFNVVFLYFF